MQAEDKHDHDGGMQIAIHAAHSTFFFNVTDFFVYFFFNPTDFNKLLQFRPRPAVGEHLTMDVAGFQQTGSCCNQLCQITVEECIQYVPLPVCDTVKFVLKGTLKLQLTN